MLGRKSLGFVYINARRVWTAEESARGIRSTKYDVRQWRIQKKLGIYEELGIHE